MYWLPMEAHLKTCCMLGTRKGGNCFPLLGHHFEHLQYTEIEKDKLDTTRCCSHPQEGVRVVKRNWFIHSLTFSTFPMTTTEGAMGSHWENITATLVGANEHLFFNWQLLRGTYLKYKMTSKNISYSFNFRVTVKKLLLIQNGFLTNKSSQEKGTNYNKSVLLRIKLKCSWYLPLLGQWIWEGSSAEHQLWMRRGPLWTQYSVRSLHLFGFVWWTSDVLDPSDHPLYLGPGPGPTRQPTPTPGVRKMSHIREKIRGMSKRETAEIQTEPFHAYTGILMF